MPFEIDAFSTSLNSIRLMRNKTWKSVAWEAGVSASTLTRIMQGKRPDVDSLSALCKWAQFNANDFLNKDGEILELPPLATYTVQQLIEIIYHRIHGNENLS